METSNGAPLDKGRRDECARKAQTAARELTEVALDVSDQDLRANSDLFVRSCTLHILGLARLIGELNAAIGRLESLTSGE